MYYLGLILCVGLILIKAQKILSIVDAIATIIQLLRGEIGPLVVDDAVLLLGVPESVEHLQYHYVRDDSQ